MANVREITDFSAPELDVYARLTENQLVNRAEPEKGMFIAESPLVIGRALDAGYTPVSFLMEPKDVETRGKALLERCGRHPRLRGRAGRAHPAHRLPPDPRHALRHVPEAPACGGAASAPNAKRIAVLEDVMNPTNIGAIIRSAAALHMDALVLTSACSDPLYRRAIRVSMGNVFQIPWTYFPKGADWTNQLHQLGFKTVAMALKEDSLDIYDPRLQQEDKLAVVLGTEGDGLAAETIAHCDYTVRIPMSHGVDSLNVAAASAVAFYQLGLLHDRNR